MHDIKWIRDNAAAFDTALRRRNLSEQEKEQYSSKRLITLDEARRAAITAFEQAQAARNAASKEIGEAKRTKDDARANELMAKIADLKESLPQLEKAAKEEEAKLDKALAQIPNMPLDDVPEGKDANDNVEHHHFGARRDYSFKPKQHFELGEALGQMDFETAAKLSGARFVVLKLGLARLERALAQFMLDVHTSAPHNYTEVAPPLMVYDDVMFGTGQLPKFADDQFLSLSKREHLALATWVEVFNRAKDADIDPEDAANRDKIDLLYDEEYSKQPQYQRRWLIPTAEVPLTNLVRESIVDEDKLPLRYTACTPCFRAEAGAAGKDTRGMIRQHQFTKVELVSITTPEQSKDEHERMLSCAEEVLRRLDLHYRVVTLCTGDMGFAAQKTYDIEVWLPGQNAYREISSCSNCGAFQARRMNARYRPRSTSEAGLARAGAARAGSGPRFVHTLNGSGVAVGRALIAVMETYQQADGPIAVPDALQPYMGGVKTIERVA
jgi:seryl-tRNA synthetase